MSLRGLFVCDFVLGFCFGIKFLGKIRRFKYVFKGWHQRYKKNGDKKNIINIIS